MPPPRRLGTPAARDAMLNFPDDFLPFDDLFTGLNHRFKAASTSGVPSAA